MYVAASVCTSEYKSSKGHKGVLDDLQLEL